MSGCLSGLLRGATVTRLRFNTKSGWVDAPAERIRDIMNAATKPADPGAYSRAANADEVRTSILKMVAVHSPAHPSLGWQVNGTLVAHRRHYDGVTACGRRGELTVATDRGIPPCPKCYPAAE